MKKKINFWALIAISIISLLIFSKFFTKGLYPIPSDLLVSFYFPWYSGGWNGYDQWTTHKASIGDDSLRQQIPWVKLAYDEIKKGHVPLWNPYNFSGNPQLANVQTFIFYPLNFVFLMMPIIDAWSLLIFTQFFLGMLFFYLYLKKIGTDSFAAILASMAFVFSSVFVFNSLINIINHSIIWTPLVLYCYESLRDKFKARYVLLSTFAIIAILLGGNTQTAVYALMLSFGYILFIDLVDNSKRKASPWIFLSFVFALLLAAFQLFPMLELYFNSPLGTHHPLFNKFLMPPKNLITFLAPDFYGSSATNNFWSQLYGDGTPHIGVIPIIFAVFVLFNLKDYRAKFFALSTIFSLFFIMPTPLSAFVNFAPIPVLSGSPPVRAVFITSFSLAFLAAYGLNNFIRSKNHKSILKTLLIFIILYGITIVFVGFTIKTSQNPSIIANFKISLRNLVIPSFTFGLFLSAYLLFLRTKLLKPFIIFCLIITLASFLYSTNKILPFSKKQFFFPDHPVLDFLKSDKELSRFYGIDTAMFATNFASYYRIYSPEGYGVLRLKRYAELIAASKNGEVPNEYERADAVFPALENGYRKRAFDLLGVKYFLDKNDMEEKEWNPEPERFPQDKVELMWQQGKFKIYKRLDAIPRYFQTTNYHIETEKEIIRKIYDKNFDLKTLLLEDSPNIPIESESNFAVPQLVEYSPNLVKFKTETPYSSLLFISDSYEKGWKAFIDNNKAPILRADYAFRSVAVPEGSHEVVLKYEPKLFSIGILTSFLTLILIAGFVKIQLSKKNF